MKLREGVKFQNGEDFTAEDVVFNADRLQELNNTFGDAYVKTEAVDEHTVRFIGHVDLAGLQQGNALAGLRDNPHGQPLCFGGLTPIADI